MARYIDAEELLKKNMYGNANPIVYRTYAENLIKSAPTADVVPRAELAVQSFQDAATIHSLQKKIKELNVEIILLQHIPELHRGVLEELAREIFEEIEKEIEEALKSNYKARSAFEPSDELYQWVQGKIDALRGIECFLAELKKKYTEVENDRKAD